VAMVVAILNSPSALVRGVCRNALLEPSANVFVGSLDTKRVKRLIDVLESTGTIAVLLVSSPKASMGMRVKVIGDQSGRQIVEVDGVQLVSRSGKPR
jgi:CRISPR-associated endoribonuclease Cas2 subtype I-E